MSFFKMKEILRILIPNDIETQENFEDIGEYIEKMGNTNLEAFQNELHNLSEEKRILKEQTQELAFANYKTFVETADTSRCIMNDFTKTKECVEVCLNNLPEFIKECDAFTCITQNNIKRKSQMSKIRMHSEKLIELVNLPILMRRALNKADYDSALDLFTFIGNLSSRHSDVPIILQISSEVNTLWFETLFQLYNQLRYDLPLPQCLQILSYLRRANTIYNSSTDGAIGDTAFVCDALHLHFLKARSAWLKNSIDEAISVENQDRILRKVVEQYRIHLFNVLTQHKAIFLSDVQETRDEDELNGNVALSSWLQQKTELLKTILTKNLDKEDDSTLESLYNQCMFLSLSFGRVGADMRCVLTPLFHNHTLNTFSHSIENIIKQFESDMKNYKVSNIAKSAPQTTDPSYNGPPEVLLDFYPLAEYCNTLLTVLNTIRVTAPLSMAQDVYKGFRYSFDRVTEVLLGFYHREQQTFSLAERNNYASLCKCFVDDLVPYLIKCLSQVFPDVAIAEHLGVTLTVLQETKIFHVDSMKYTELLSHIMLTKHV